MELMMMFFYSLYNITLVRNVALGEFRRGLFLFSSYFFPLHPNLVASVATMDEGAVFVSGEHLEFLGSGRTAQVVGVGIFCQGDVTISANDVESPLDALFL